MQVASPLSQVCELLEQKYGKLGQGAAGRLRLWMSGTLPFTYPEMLEKHLEEDRLGLLFDSFWQVLPFGTGGRRGRVGYGPNRLNPTTVALTVQGHCGYLRQKFSSEKQPFVVVANDVRVFNDLAGTYDFLGKSHPLLGVSSRSLGRLACEVYAGNGIVAYFAEPEAEFAVLSTPELSFDISKLGAAGGINLSASHNPPDDNGIKVYDQFGSQPVAPDDQVLVESMERVESVRSMPFNEALSKGLIRTVPQELHHEYVQAYVDLYEGFYNPQPDMPLVYTPLCGCGLTTVGDVLTELKFPFLTPPDEGPDGKFSVIPFRAPNPEVPQATHPAKAYADQHGAGIVLSSDPDADRIGIEIKLKDGSWQHLDGNQIAAILCYFLMLDPEGPRRKGLVIETLVTTKILSKIVERAGNSCLVDDLLVGFKYVADLLKDLEQQKGRYQEIKCSPDQLVLATEESHGVIMIPTIRDKDAVPGCMYFAALYQKLRAQGRTLLDYYIHILDEIGPYGDTSRSIMMTGADGIFRRDEIMASLRKTPLQTVAGATVRQVVDHWDQDAKTFGPFKSETDKLPRNVIQYFFDTFVVAVRPSGTEPKLKFYCQILPDQDLLGRHGHERFVTVTEKAEKTAVLIYKELLARIGVELEEPALLLPDIVDLGRKQEFQARTIPALANALKNRQFKALQDCLEWLKKEARAMTPGADPLPALKAPLMSLIRQWSESGQSFPLMAELRGWATT